MNTFVVWLGVFLAPVADFDTIENAKSWCHWALEPGKGTSAIRQPGYRPTGAEGFGPEAVAC